MKSTFFITMGVIVIFGLLTLATYEDNAMVDGFTQLGFPFRFYIQTSGKLTDPKYAAEFGYFPKYLVYDAIVLFAAIFVVNITANKLMMKKVN